MMNAFDLLKRAQEKKIPERGPVPEHIKQYVLTHYEQGKFSSIKLRMYQGPAFYLYTPDGRQRTFLLRKLWAEILMGRKIKKGEIIDWSDPDHPKTYLPEEESRELLPQKCPVCSKMFTPTWRQYQSQKHNQVAGPFCSRTCLYKYRKLIKDGMDPIPPTPIKRKEEPLTLDSYFRNLYTK